LALDWHTVKALEMQYMEAQLARAGTPSTLTRTNPPALNLVDPPSAQARAMGVSCFA